MPSSRHLHKLLIVLFPSPFFLLLSLPYLPSFLASTHPAICSLVHISVRYTFKSDFTVQISYYMRLFSMTLKLEWPTFTVKYKYTHAQSCTHRGRIARVPSNGLNPGGQASTHSNKADMRRHVTDNNNNNDDDDDDDDDVEHVHKHQSHKSLGWWPPDVRFSLSCLVLWGKTRSFWDI